MSEKRSRERELPAPAAKRQKPDERLTSFLEACKAHDIRVKTDESTLVFPSEPEAYKESYRIPYDFSDTPWAGETVLRPEHTQAFADALIARQAKRAAALVNPRPTATLARNLDTPKYLLFCIVHKIVARAVDA